MCTLCQGLFLFCVWKEMLSFCRCRRAPGLEYRYMWPYVLILILCKHVGLLYMHIFCQATLCPNGRTALPCALQRPHFHTHLPATPACCSEVSADTTQQQHDTMGADSHAPPICAPALFSKPNMAAPGATKRHVYVKRYTHMLIKGKWQKTKYTHALIKNKSRKSLYTHTVVEGTTRKHTLFLLYTVLLSFDTI